jgi:eukaryotic-like serine/threonine-protein kinase
MNADVQKVRSIFLAAVENHAPAQWASYLDEACSGDEELRNRVDELLQAHAESNSLLDNPGPALVATLDEPLRERPGTVIGPYKLLEHIGEGGFGVVFMAEQQRPVRRKVALKVLKPGMDTKQVIARFEAERQALALMDHPNIARVLEAGETSSGRPYFVMELVRGLAMTDYCDQHSLPVRDRLELFIDICHAVQHAHHKGIIHRDIKPSNVLVTLHDGKPVVKVIDFGIAKAMGQQLTDKTLFTNFAQMIGTPLYMSPEQAEMSGLDVDTRSDIYALGVVLYELLTGTTPFDKERFKQAGYDEMRRIIREEEPPKPSTRMSTVGLAATTASDKRQSDPRKLSRLFRGELDWIVMKCLEKDRNRRFDTANSLVKDINRYLHDEPVKACPPSAAYRLRKFVRRNRTAVAAAVATVGLLVVAVLGLTISNLRITQEQALTKKERDEAEANFRKARQAVDDQFTLVSQSTLFEAPGFQSLRKDLLESALKYYLDFLQQRPDDPELQVEVAAAYLRLYQIYMANDSGLGQEAIQALGKGVEIVETLLRQHPNDAELYSRLAGFGKGIRALHSVDTGPKRHADLLIALAGFERATTVWKNLVRDYPTEFGFQFDLAEFYAHTHELQLEAHRPAEALSTIRISHEINKNLVREKPNVPEYRAELAFTHRHLAERLKSDAPLEEVENHYRAYLQMSQSLEAEFPKVPQYRATVADAIRCQGSWWSDTERLPEAEEAYGRALTLFEELVTKFPSFPSYRGEFANCHDCLGDLLRHAGKAEKAEEAYRQAQIIWQKLADEFPDRTEYRRMLAVSSFNQCLMLAASGRRPEADQVYRKVLDLKLEDPQSQNDLAWLLTTSPDPQFRDPSRAVELAKKAVVLAPKRANFWNTLGAAHYCAGNWNDAVTALEKSMKLNKGGDSYDWFFLAMAHWKLGYKEQARKWYDQAISWMEKNQPRNEHDREELARFRAEAANLLGIEDQSREKEKPHAKAPGC